MYRIHHVDPVMSYIPWHVLIALSCLTLCNPLDCSPPGSSVHGILQARIVALSTECLISALHPELFSEGIKGQKSAAAHD